VPDGRVWGRGAGFLANSQKRGLRRSSLDNYVSKSSVNIRKPKRSRGVCSVCYHRSVCLHVGRPNKDCLKTRFKSGGWSRQQKRAYQRVLSFLKYNEKKGRKVSWVTLTSAPESEPKLLMIHFQILRKRLSRRGIEFEYFNVRTSEGYGVLHLLFAFKTRKWHISQNWLSKNWEKIHGAPIVWIKKYRYKTAKRMSRYIVGQYCASQKGFQRYSWSRKELSGFVRAWYFLKKFYEGRKLFRIWEVFLGGKILYLKTYWCVYRVKPPPNIKITEWKPLPLSKFI
jgi:hypothetical protein